MTQIQSTDDPASKSNWLTLEAEKTQRLLGRWRGRDAGWSWARLGFFLLAAAPWLIWRGNVPVAGTVCVLFAVLFVLAVGIHLQVRRRREFLERVERMLQESRQRLGGMVEKIRSGIRPEDPADASVNLSPILDTGQVWRLTEQEWDDLDLYAPPVGIFGLLNRTSTNWGARWLRDRMDRSGLFIDQIKARQESVRWIERRPEIRIRLMAAAAELRNRDGWLDQLVTAVVGAQPLPWPAACAVIRVWSVPSGLFLAFSITQFYQGRIELLLPVFVLLLINGILYRVIRPHLKTALTPWENLGPTASALLSALRHIHSALPAETELGRLRTALAGALAHRALPSLTRRLAWTGSGGPIHLLLNLTIFYDLHLAALILSRVLDHRENLLQAGSALADLEVIYSLAAFAWEQPVTSYPEPTDRPTVSITDGQHPLISPEKAVANGVDLSAETRMWIVTGPNAAGKSTFLRMIGVNVLLAQMGSAVTARRMAWSPVRLMTDLRVRDDLAREESYFLSEVRHLRRMVNPEPGDVPILGLVDEPFRGTNSRDKRAASLALAEHLADGNHFFLIATHEDALTHLAETIPVKNFHFQERLGPEGLVFDYRLHEGPARTTTAIQILQREGYPAPLIDAARRHLA